MSDSTTQPNPIQTLASAELAIVLKPVDDFLTALQAPGANTETIVQDFAKLQLAAIQDVPELESVGIGNLAGIIQAKLHGLVNAAGGPAAGTTDATKA